MTDAPQGEGACGKVFKALRGGVQDVAVKVLVYTDDEALAKFMEVRTHEQELQACAHTPC